MVENTLITGTPTSYLSGGKKKKGTEKLRKCKRSFSCCCAVSLDVVAQVLPALLTPCSRRGRVRQTVSIAKRFQRGEWKGALSKANQAITSNLLPNSDPLNIENLRSKHTEPAHPDRDPVRDSSILGPRPDTLQVL